MTDFIVERALAQLGDRRFRRSDYVGLANAFGLAVEHTDRIVKPAYLVGTTIYVRADQPPFTAAFYVREEIGHHLTVAGSREFWRSRPQGEVTFQRFERLAHSVRRGIEAAGIFLPN